MLDFRRRGGGGITPVRRTFVWSGCLENQDKEKACLMRCMILKLKFLGLNLDFASEGFGGGGW